MDGIRRIVEGSNNIGFPIRERLSSSKNDEEETPPPVPPRKPEPPADDPGEEDPDEKEKEEKCRQLKNDLRIVRIRLEGAESDLRKKTEESNPALEEWRQAERDLIKARAEATAKTALSAGRSVLAKVGTIVTGVSEEFEVAEAKRRRDEAKQRFEAIQAEIEFLNGEIENLRAEQESIEAEIASLGCR